jgi:hypothetical protein
MAILTSDAPGCSGRRHCRSCCGIQASVTEISNRKSQIVNSKSQIVNNQSQLVNRQYKSTIDNRQSAMDITLIGVTLLSFAMAIALSVVVWRLLRDERRRSEARVAALADMMSRSASESVHSASQTFRALIVTPEARRKAPPVEPRPARPLDLPLHEPAAPVSSLAPSMGSMFSEQEHSSPWKGRAAVMAGLALVAAAGLFLTLTLRDRARAQAAGSAGTRSAVAATAPLELLSLRDAHDENRLTISGVVQNPRNGGMLRQVTVTAQVFDTAGTLLASGQALLDVTALGPGDNSAFVVSVPVSGAVARYRIGFRGEDGRVIAHVDKRQRGAVAAAVRQMAPTQL